MARNLSDKSIPLDELQGTWNQLTDRLDAFITAWDTTGTAPVLEDYVPDGSIGLRRLILVELIKADIGRRAHQQSPPRIEEYVQRFPELREGGVPIDLLFEEFHIRRRAGEAVRVEEYQQRFPDRAEPLARLLARGSGSSAQRDFLPWAKPAEPGDHIDEFQVLRLLGKGAFAKVYLVWQPSMQRTVALKVSADRGIESQTLAQLDHPNIVSVFDQRLLPEQRTRLLYMSFVAGGTLLGVLEHLKSLPRDGWNGEVYLNAIEDAVRNSGGEITPRTPLQKQIALMTWPEIVAWIGARLAEALDYAHRKGVLHRDIKPANILLAANAQPQLADFNIGTVALKEPAPDATFGGSLPYMSPEHLEAMHPDRRTESVQIDQRSDIYQLGMMLWELLAGQRPFVDEKFTIDLDLTIDELLISRRAGVPAQSLAALPVGCPAELVAVLKKCLAPEPANRYASAAELATELALCQDSEALALLRPKPGGWRAWVRRWPISWVFLIGLAPNFMIALPNIHYNHAAVISARPEAEALFWKLVQVINAILYPLGLSVFFAAVWPVAKALRKCEQGEPISATEMSHARFRCLRLGLIAGRICVACWLVAGVVWPITLDVLAGTLSWDAHLHFLASLTVCGMIAGIYPFFFVSLLSIRALLPALLQHSALTPTDRLEVNRLERASSRNRLLAAAVPLIGAAAMVTIDLQDRMSMLAITLMGLGGCVVAYFCDRRLSADLAVLKRTFFSTN